MERLRNLSGRGASAEGDTPKSQGTTSPKSQDTWRDLDPKCAGVIGARRGGAPSLSDCRGNLPLAHPVPRCALQAA